MKKCGFKIHFTVLSFISHRKQTCFQKKLQEHQQTFLMEIKYFSVIFVDNYLNMPGFSNRSLSKMLCYFPW